MDNKQAILTAGGFKKISAELESIEMIQINRVEERVNQAIKHGNKEEIEDAKAERQFLSDRIIYLKHLLQTAKQIG